MQSYTRSVGYFVYRLYTTRIKCIITLLSLHASALLGHHQVTKVYNYDIKVKKYILVGVRELFRAEGANDGVYSVR
jgi:hypothetical protein